MARIFGLSMREVRLMSWRDIEAMTSVLKEEQDERERQASKQRSKGARR